MSLGMGGMANLICSSDMMITFEYGAYNLNEPQYRNEEHKCDGRIYIDRTCFIEPELHRKIKKFPNGRKKIIEKRIVKQVDYEKMIADGLIHIDNCSMCWRKNEQYIDVVALYLIHKILNLYQEDGYIRESVSYDV